MRSNTQVSARSSKSVATNSMDDEGNSTRPANPDEIADDLGLEHDADETCSEEKQFLRCKVEEAYTSSFSPGAKPESIEQIQSTILADMHMSTIEVAAPRMLSQQDSKVILTDSPMPTGTISDVEVDASATVPGTGFSLSRPSVTAAAAAAKSSG